MYTSPDQAPRSFGGAPRQPLTDPMIDQDPISTTHQYGRSHRHGKSHQHGNSHQHGKSHQHGNSRQHGKSHHWTRLLICTPTLLVVADYLWVRRVSLAAGGVPATLMPTISCMLMVWLMMRMMGHGSQH